jgi:hypothetical protein
MTRERAWPVRVMYILIAAALAMSLMIMAAPAQKLSAANDEVEAEWDRVSTPTTEDWVVAPESVIIDYALADGGDVAYAVVEAYDDDPCDDSSDSYDFRLLKSDDSAATWDDLTEALEDVDDENDISELVQVATDWEDPDFVAVALWEDGELRVYFSIDGGDSFEDAEWVEDGGIYFDDADDVSDLAVSYEEDDERDIAIGGVAYNSTSTAYRSGLFRCTVSGDNAGNWEDATEYDGWDDTWDPVVHSSELVTDIIFSPSWTTDKTILVTTVDTSGTWDSDIEDGDVHLQCGSWGTSPGWNEKSTLGIEAVLILDDEDIPMWLADWDARAIAGITLPEDYDSDNTADRIFWVWVNYYDGSGDCMCQITRVEDDSAGPLIGGSMAQVENGEIWLTNISYQGTIDEGKAIAGVLGTGAYVTYKDELFTECCEGVQVYRNDGISEMDICCERWHDACKPPTGRAAMAVSYVGEDKAYAVALQGTDDYEEGAWSVTFDNGDTWNQLSLIDTYIDFFSDVAVSPDCNKTMLVSVNVEKVCIDYSGGEPIAVDGCDSVWLHAEDLPEAEEYSGKWLRTWCGELEGDDWWHDDGYYEAGMLRLAPEELEGDDVRTVYLFDYWTSNVYYNDLETLACWEPIGSTSVEEIVDLAAQDADTVFALDADGDVSMFDDDEWHAAVESELDCGFTIAVWGDHILVGGCESDVSYSDDGGETFTELEDVATVDCFVTVAFDSYFDTNSTIYAGLDDNDEAVPASGVYRWIIDESEAWKDLRVEPLEPLIGIDDDDGEDDLVEVNITGLVLDRPDPGNPMTSPDTGGVLYASYYGYAYDDVLGWVWFTGVARYLTPAEDVVCKECGDWDYLIEGLTDDGIDWEGFEAYPDALKICGCLEATSNSKLFAIDAWWDYDICDGEEGAVWMFEDCYAKKAPDLTSPADGEVIDADPCSCYSEPFTLMWDRLCDACSYDLQIALDEDFDEVVLDTRYFCDEEENVLDPLCHYVPPAGDAPAYHILGGMAGGLSCETTYYWRVRAADAETDQIIHSWWSDPLSFTVGPSIQAGEITLVSPEPGATGVAIKNVGFSWDLSAEADEFDWVLDDNSDLSSPVESKTGLTAKAYGCTQTLSYSTTYYWQVTAYNEGAEISTSAIGTFTTAATGQFCCPQCGLCFDTQEELEAHMAEEHPAQPATPTWVWIVIAIGAVLVIVVIVLIFRTRRV